MYTIACYSVFILSSMAVQECKWKAEASRHLPRRSYDTPQRHQERRCWQGAQRGAWKQRRRTARAHMQSRHPSLGILDNWQREHAEAGMTERSNESTQSCRVKHERRTASGTEREGKGGLGRKQFAIGKCCRVQQAGNCRCMTARSTGTARGLLLAGVCGW